MPRRTGGSSSKKQDERDQEIAALTAITNAFLQEVKEVAKLKAEKPKVMQIIIYESSV